jgi:hypothetical protein
VTILNEELRRIQSDAAGTEQKQGKRKKDDLASPSASRFSSEKECRSRTKSVGATMQQSVQRGWICARRTFCTKTPLQEDGSKERSTTILQIVSESISVYDFHRAPLESNPIELGCRSLGVISTDHPIGRSYGLPEILWKLNIDKVVLTVNNKRVKLSTIKGCPDLCSAAQHTGSCQILVFQDFYPSEFTPSYLNMTINIYGSSYTSSKLSCAHVYQLTLHNFESD